jgi:hypothetical protein
VLLGENIALAARAESARGILPAPRRVGLPAARSASSRLRWTGSHQRANLPSEQKAGNIKSGVERVRRGGRGRPG